MLGVKGMFSSAGMWPSSKVLNSMVLKPMPAGLIGSEGSWALIIWSKVFEVWNERAAFLRVVPLDFFVLLFFELDLLEPTVCRESSSLIVPKNST